MNVKRFIVECGRLLHRSDQIEHAEAQLAAMESEEMFLQIVRSHGQYRGWTEHHIAIGQACVMTAAVKMLEDVLKDGHGEP